MQFDLTLLGHSPRSYPVLVELAAEAWGRSAEASRVQIVHNLPLPDELGVPDGWHAPSPVDLSDWHPDSLDGVIMPGVMAEPAVSAVVTQVLAQTAMPISRFGTIVHPSASVAPSAQIGPGTWIHPHATVASLSVLGPCCSVNRNASVGHHNRWGAFSRLNPGAHTAGLCQLGERVTIGIGAAVRQKLTLGDGAFVGGGSMVVKDVLAGQTVVGVPAKPI